MLPTPPHWATSRPPGRRTAARFANNASWSGTQWKVAVDRIASTGALERQRPPEVRDDVLDPVAERRQPLAGGRRSSPASRRARRPCRAEARRQELGDPTGPAAGVEDAFVAGQRQAVEDGRAPARLRLGDPVVGRGVPVAGHRSSPSSARRRRRGAQAAAGVRAGRRRHGRAGTLAQPEPRHQRPDDEQSGARPASPSGTRRSRPGSTRRPGPRSRRRRAG